MVESKMKSWCDVDKYREEIESYLIEDVKAVYELAVAFNSKFYEKLQINLFKFMTIGQAAFQIFRSFLDPFKQEIELFRDSEKYNFVQKAKYGGRVHPYKNNFKSKFLDELFNGNMTYEQFMKKKDYLITVDLTSHYPASMRGVDYIDKPFKYPVGRWSNKPKEEFKKDKLGFYEVNFIPPTNIRFPVLPRKEKENLIWGLTKGHGGYCNVDINDSMECGYKIEFINKCLVWDNSSTTLFDKYIDFWFKLKQQCDSPYKYA